jgi:hypothetical protein
MDTLWKIGVACIVAAILGGGLKMPGIGFPPLRSWTRQLLLFLAGVLFVLYGYDRTRPVKNVEFVGSFSAKLR